MTKKAPTTGKSWTVQKNESANALHAPLLVVGDGGYIVCEVVRVLDETIGNANLLAAAPEMEEALEAVADVLVATMQNIGEKTELGLGIQECLDDVVYPTLNKAKTEAKTKTH